MLNTVVSGSIPCPPVTPVGESFIAGARLS
jgi:hypothetical protein